MKPDNIEVHFQGIFMEDDNRSLASYGVNIGDTVDLLSTYRMQLFVKEPVMDGGMISS